MCNLKQALSISELRVWFDILKRRRALGESVPSISEVAFRACLSRQTVYALLRGERSEFGAMAQIRLSRVIQQISAEITYGQTRLMKVDLSGRTAKILLGGQR
jgi:hypothetical protein